MKNKKEEIIVEHKFPSSSKGLNIYFHVSENSGVGYYRQYLQAWKLREKGLANVMISDFRWGEGDHVEPDMKLQMKILEWADLVIVGRKDLGGFYASWGAFKDFFKIPIILDTDDNVSFVRPQNPGYQAYYPGAEAITWNQFAIAKVFDAITVSTENLKKFYEKYNPKIFVIPNSLDVAEWDNFPKKEWNDGFTRIGFIASAAHPEGVRIIKKPVVDILTKYPKTKFLITHVFHGMFNDCPKEILSRIEPIQWIRLQEWTQKYKELGLDIGLAPLADNMFNRAKSNLRWMEYCVQKVAPVVSPVEAYSCVKNNIDGLVAKEKEEWYTCIERLLDSDFRKKIAENGYQRIKAEFNIDNNISRWYNVYKEIHEKYHSFFGNKKRYLIDNKGLQEIGARRR